MSTHAAAACTAVVSCPPVVKKRAMLTMKSGIRPHRRFATTVAAAAGGGGNGGAGIAKVAVFVSGGGSNLRALHAAMEDGRVNAEVVAVVSNAHSCGGVARAQELSLIHI